MQDLLGLLQTTFTVQLRRNTSSSTTQTLLSSVGGDKEQAQQTQISASDFMRMERAAARGYAAEARDLSRSETDQNQGQQTDVDAPQWLEMEAIARKAAADKIAEAAAKEQAAQAQAKIEEELRVLRTAHATALQQVESLQSEAAKMAVAADAAGKQSLLLDAAGTASSLATEDSMTLLSEAEFSIYDYDLPAEVLAKFFKLQGFFGTCTVDAAQEFTDHNLLDLVGLLDIHPTEKGDMIIQQGEEATWFGVLLEGELEVLVNDNHVAIMGPGALMGELGFLENGHGRTASCVAHTEGVVAAIPYRRIMKLHETSPDLYVKFMLLVAEAGVTKLQATGKRLGGRIGDLEAQIEQLQMLEQGSKEVPKAVAVSEDNDKDSKEEEEEAEEVVEEEEEDDSGSEPSQVSNKSSHKHGRRRVSNRGKKKDKNKKKREFSASSNSEVFYRTKVAQAEKTVEVLQLQHVEEEKQKEKLRSRWKREQVHRKAMEKEMEIMRMKLAAAGVEHVAESR